MDNPPARTPATRWMEGLEPRRRELVELTLQLCLLPDLHERLAHLRASGAYAPGDVVLFTRLLYAAQQLAIAEGRTPAVLLPRPLSMGGHDRG